MRFPGRLIRGPVRPDRRSVARFASLRWAALPITDRRWTAPLSAVALGFGLFVGVAIGPGTEGSLGTTSPMVIQIPAPAPPQTASAPPASGDRDRGNANHSGGSETPPAETHPSGPPPVFDTPSTTPSLPAPAPPVTSDLDAGTEQTTPTTTTDETEPDQTTGDQTTSDDQGSTDSSTTALAGTVVHLNSAAESYTVATDGGELIAIHSRNAPKPGKAVEVEARQLANGTYVEAGKREEGAAKGRASFAGTVSFSDPVTGVYTVSAPGASLLVRGGAQRNPPGVGERVEVTARIAENPEPLPVTTPGEDGCGKPPALPKAPRVALEQVGLKVPGGERATTTDVEAIVEGVCRDSRKLIVSADDIRESGHDISIAIPKAIRIARLKPGQVLKLGVEIAAGGGLNLTTVAGDEGSHGAEDPDLVQSGESQSEGSDTTDG